MAQSVCEMMWVHQRLIELGFNIMVSTKLWRDNQAAFHIASTQYLRSKLYIEIDCHILLEKNTKSLVLCED